MPKRQAAAHAQPPRPVVPPPPRPEPAASASAAPPAEPTDAVANGKHTDMRAILPPQPAPFDAAFVDAACAHYEMPDLDPKRLAAGIDWDDVDLETELPCAGLGFDLRGLDWEPVEGGRDWARPFTRRPLVDIGLRFDGVTEHGLAGFATLLDFYKPGGRGVPQPNGSRHVAGYAMPRPEHAWLLATLPALLPPGSDEPWVRAYDLRDVVHVLGDDAAAAGIALTEWRFRFPDHPNERRLCAPLTWFLSAPLTGSWLCHLARRASRTAP